MDIYVLLLALGLIAAAANIIGGYLIASQRDINQFWLRLLIALGAGFILAAVLLEVVPYSTSMSRTAGVLILAGYLFVQLVEHTIADHFHFGEETHPEAVLAPGRAYTAVSGLLLHTYFDGVLIGSGFLVSMKLGVLLFVAILLHKIPEGFTAASIMRAAGKSRLVVFSSSVAVAVSTLIGIFSASLARGLTEKALPFSAGVTLYVAASDLIPEVNRERGSLISLFVFAGVALYLIGDGLLKRLLGQ